MPPDSPYPETINFDFVKTSDFRVEHADGTFIALTQGGLMISFYSEGQPIPKRVVHKVTLEGVIGDEILEQRVVRDRPPKIVDFRVVHDPTHTPYENYAHCEIRAFCEALLKKNVGGPVAKLYRELLSTEMEKIPEDILAADS